MTRSLIVVMVIFAGILSFYGLFLVQRDRALLKIVKHDFFRLHSEYEFIECNRGETEWDKALVHVKFKKPPNDSVYEEV